MTCGSGKEHVTGQSQQEDPKGGVQNRRCQIVHEHPVDNSENSDADQDKPKQDSEYANDTFHILGILWLEQQSLE